jgi:hypothetical protein
MATKAERFRAAVEQSRSKAHSKVENARVEKLSREPPPGRSTHVGRKAIFKLEETVGNARPSRKSTRKAANRVKPESNLEQRQKRSTHSPEARARKASVQRGARDERVARRRTVR